MKSPVNSVISPCNFKNTALGFKKGVEYNQNKAADIDMSGYVPEEH